MNANEKQIYNLILKGLPICTDTRKIMEGCLFFALKGPNFNANQFAQKAIDSGASWVVVDEEISGLDSERSLVVPDVLTTLQNLAQHHRKQLDIPVVGIGGSNGKTTTKELMAAALSTKFKVHYTQGNLNNHIGVPLTLLRMPMDTEIAVIEMGTNQMGDIEFLCNIAQPTHGIITNIAKEHLEGFGSLEGVAKAESELYYYLYQNKGFAFVNQEDEWLIRMSRNLENKTSYPNPKTLNLQLIKGIPFVQFSLDNEQYTSHLSGGFNFQNISAALAVAQHFEVDLNAAAVAIADYQPQNNRSQVIKTQNNNLLLDAYNANPGSVGPALESFAQFEESNKVVILGDMFELGDQSESEHKSMAQLASDLQFNEVILCGKWFAKEAKNIGAKGFETKEALENHLKENPLKNAWILIKGSRGMALETLVDLL